MRRTNRSRPTAIGSILAIALLASALAGCSTAPDGGSPAAGEDQPCLAAAGFVPQAFSAVGAAAGGPSAADFDPVGGTEELAALAEVVVRGEVVDAQDGPIAGRPDDEFSDIRVVILSIGNVEVLSGELPAESDGNVYLAISAPMGAEIVRGEVPAGTPVLLYGERIVDERSDGDIPLTDAEAVRPAGQPVFRAAHPQGLVYQFGTGPDSELIWPNAQYTARGTLDDAAPGGPLVGYAEHGC